MLATKSRITAIIVLVLYFLLALAQSSRAQDVVLQGTTFVEQGTPKQAKSPKKTQYLYVTKESKDTIYVSSTGKYFIWKTSKKTGKKYRKYLPKVTEQLNAKK